LASTRVASTPFALELEALLDMAELDTDPFNTFLSLAPPLAIRALNESLSALTLSNSFNIWLYPLLCFSINFHSWEFWEPS
jgi:hypothetical protein